jgi:hypothetical protein
MSPTETRLPRLLAHGQLAFLVRAKTEHFEVEASPEILRPKEGLQDDRLYTTPLF